jgi:hypothetical protein
MSYKGFLLAQQKSKCEVIRSAMQNNNNFFQKPENALKRANGLLLAMEIEEEISFVFLPQN